MSLRRLDLQHRYCRNVLQPYTMQDARSAFHRLLRHHQANGWDSTPPDHSHPGHRPPTAPTPSWSGHSTDALTDGASPSQLMRANAGQTMFRTLTSASQSRHLAFSQSSQHTLISSDQPGQHFQPTSCDGIQHPGARLRHRLSKAAGTVSDRDGVTDPSEAHAKGDNTPLIVSQQPDTVLQPPVTMSQRSVSLSQQPTQAATWDHAGPHNESGANGQGVLAQPVHVDLTNSSDGSNSQQYEGEKGTRGRSQSPLKTTAKRNGMQHEGDKGAKNVTCSPESLLEDPSDGAEANMRAMSEEAVDLLSPEKLVVDHSAAFSAGHDARQMQASAQVRLPCHALPSMQHCCTFILQSPHAVLYCQRATNHSQAIVLESTSSHLGLSLHRIHALA